MAAQREEFAGWAILELMGHRRLAGYVQEAEIAGAAFVRIDLPRTLDHGEVAVGAPDEVAATQFYAPGAVYCITPTTEDTARRVAESSTVGPVSEWELPHRPALAAGEREEDDLDF